MPTALGGKGCQMPPGLVPVCLPCLQETSEKILSQMQSSQEQGRHRKGANEDVGSIRWGWCLAGGKR